jgi:peptidyl-prolyl cis-trans isomerase A (cyclophilin A)
MRFLVSVLLFFSTFADAQIIGNPKKATSVYAILQTSFGDIRIKLFHDKARGTVNNFIGLALGKKESVDPTIRKKIKKAFYNGLTFHRVVPNFVIQGGDPLANGKGGPGFGIDQEISPELNFTYPGMVAMAAAKPEKNGSQFFITLKDQNDLDGSFTIFGQVVDGFEVVKAISNVKRDLFDKPVKDIVIRNVKIQYK